MVKFTVELQSKRKDPKQFPMDLPATTTVEELTVELAKQSEWQFQPHFVMPCCSCLRVPPQPKLTSTARD